VELVLAVRAGLSDVRPDLALVGATGLVPGMPDSARHRLARSLGDADVTLRLGVPVVAVEPGMLVLVDGSRIMLDEILWVTQASSPAWLAASGLATDAAGFIAVDACLRSLSHREVFASGDVAAIAGQIRPKAGVFAVRQGPPLAANLRQALAGRPPVPIRLQQHGLSLISTGDGRAVATRGRWAISGRLVWRLKDWIDRRWIARYKQPQDRANREDRAKRGS
jgi:selenide,water dikinase